MKNSRFKQKPSDERAYSWTIIFYPESAPENFLEVIQSWRAKYWLSPIHDKDVDANGVPKKEHYHLVLKFSSKKSVNQIQELSNQLSSVHVDWVHCYVPELRGMIRYLVHFDDANKAPYSLNDIRFGCGADLMDYFTDASDTDYCVAEMMKYIDESETASFAQLSRYAANNRPDWFRVLTSKRTVFISAYCKSVSWERSIGKKPLF